jgi:hypothetical protein
VIPDWIVVPRVCVLAQFMIESARQQLGVKANLCHRPGVKSKEQSLLKG